MQWSHVQWCSLLKVRARDWQCIWLVILYFGILQFRRDDELLSLLVFCQIKCAGNHSNLHSRLIFPWASEVNRYKKQGYIYIYLVAMLHKYIYWSTPYMASYISCSFSHHWSQSSFTFSNQYHSLYTHDEWLHIHMYWWVVTCRKCIYINIKQYHSNNGANHLQSWWWSNWEWIIIIIDIRSVLFNIP